MKRIGFKTHLTPKSKKIIFTKVPKPYGPLNLNEKYVWDYTRNNWIIQRFPLNLTNTFNALKSSVGTNNTPIMFIKDQIEILESNIFEPRKLVKLHNYFCLHKYKTE